jgi:hypothetical protein
LISKSREAHDCHGLKLADGRVGGNSFDDFYAPGSIVSGGGAVGLLAPSGRVSSGLDKSVLSEDLARFQKAGLSSFEQPRLFISYT